MNPVSSVFTNKPTYFFLSSCKEPFLWYLSMIGSYIPSKSTGYMMFNMYFININLFNKLTMLWYFLLMFLYNTLKQLAWHGHFLQSKKKPSALMYFTLLKEPRKLISPTPEIILISVFYFGFI